MKIDFSKPILNLEGKPYKTESGKDLTLGSVVSETLAVEKTGGKMKLYVLAQKAFKEKEMELDEADFELIKSAVKNSEAYAGNAIVLGQAMLLLEETK